MKVLKTLLLHAMLSRINTPSEKKYVTGNQLPFMNKTLSRAIMERSKLRNLFLKKRTEEKRNNNVKQRNLCATLLRKSKKSFLGV